jgi:cardiolipin synthase C
VSTRSAASVVALMALWLAGSCATLPERVVPEASVTVADTSDTFLGQQAAKLGAEGPETSGFVLLSRGLDAFVARAALVQVAERFVDVQYYLYHDDLVGSLLTWQLLRAADRGVRVRLLIDDMGLAGRDAGVAALDAHPNVEVRIFNPFSRNAGRTPQYVSRMGSVTRRMHNKSFTVDGQAAILGGRNIGNEYFEADPALAFADLDVLTIGPVAGEVVTEFELYWNSELAYPIAGLVEKPASLEQVAVERQRLDAFVASQSGAAYLEALRTSTLAEEIRARRVRFARGEGQVLYDRPEKLLEEPDQQVHQLAPKLRPLVDGARRELILFSPYFVPGKSGTALLTGLVARGVRVRILTNSLASNDVSVVHAGYARYRKALLRGGMELYELNKKLTPSQRKEKDAAPSGGSSKASLHAKSFVFDRERVFIGSMNLDPRSVQQNTEIGVVVDNVEIAEGMGSWFDRNIERLAFRVELERDQDGTESLRWQGLVHGKPQTFEVDPYSGFGQRLGVSFMGLFPIESQL